MSRWRRGWLEGRPGMSEVSVTRIEPRVGECGACEERAELGWTERELGRVCRRCASMILTLELESKFPGACLGATTIADK